MARKKTVSISRKPSAAQASPPPLAMKLQPYESAQDAPEAALSVASLNPVGRMVYGTVYCLSYGVVYSAILLGQFIPGSGLVGHALLDGAGSARRSFTHPPRRCADAKTAGVAA